MPDGQLIGIIEDFKDITERKIAKEALRKSEEKYRTVVENSHDLIFIVDPQGNFVFTNKAFEIIIGYSVREISQINGFELIHPEDLGPVKERFSKIIDGEAQNNMEYRYKTKNGSYINLLTDTVPLFDSQGKVMSVLGIARNITERKQAEAALRESEEKYSTLVEQAKDGVIIVQDGMIKFANRALAKITGYVIEEWLNKLFLDAVAPEFRELVAQKYTSRLRGEKVVDHYEFKILCRDGTKKDVEVTASIIQFAGKPASMAIIRDITERKKIEDELRKSKENLARAQEIGRIGSWELDLLTNSVNFSDQAYRILGLKPGEISPTYETCIAFVHPEDRQFVEKKLKEAIHENKPFDLEHRFIRKDGTECIVHAQAQILYDESGKPIRMIGVDQDITEQKRAERELQKVEKLESIGILAGGIAHDFNNLLTGIMGNISLAELYMTPDEGKASEILKETKKSCYQAAGLTRQLLTFSKGGAPSKKTASIKELIENTALFTLRGSRIKCECLIPDTLWPVEVDEGQISQVISNLTINAHQAMPKGGILEIRAENTTVNSEDGLPLEKGKYVKISIKDQGIGIPEEYLRSIFDPYFTTKKEGSGLGLAICFSIIKRHGGHIMVESKVGVGTTFHIFLPASLKEIFKVKAVKAIERVKIHPGTGRILLMDDQEQIRDMVGNMLNYLGYKVEFACDGDEAIELYKKAKEAGHPFDAVILDLTIPGGIGGKEVIQDLLEIDPDVKAIVSSGYSNDPIMSKWRKYGFRGAVAKPYEVKELSKVLHQVLMEIEESSHE